MVEQEAADTQADNTAGRKKALSVKLILVIFSILILAGAAGMVFKSGLLRQNPEGEETIAAAAGNEKATGPGPIYTLNPFIVNLAEERGTKYLKTKLGLELDNTMVSKEIEQRLPQFRDTILTILSSKSFDDIRQLEGKYQLRIEIMAMLNRLLKTGEIINIYFMEFVVQ